MIIHDKNTPRDTLTCRKLLLVGFHHILDNFGRFRSPWHPWQLGKFIHLPLSNFQHSSDLAAWGRDNIHPEECICIVTSHNVGSVYIYHYNMHVFSHKCLLQWYVDLNMWNIYHKCRSFSSEAMDFHGFCTSFWSSLGLIPTGEWWVPHETLDVRKKINENPMKSI